MFDFHDVLDSNGLIARKRPGYERREAQLAMAAEVEAAIRERRLLAVEAGTGVGKSFAYLVPAILYVVEDQVREFSQDWENDERGVIDNAMTSAQKNDFIDAPCSVAPEQNSPRVDSVSDASSSESLKVEKCEDDEDVSWLGGLDSDRPNELRRVVVSTHTISLQEQLFEKDIPFLNSILPFEFTAALAKGRANYVCKRRFHNALKNASNGTLFEMDLQRDIKALAGWVKQTMDGSKSELNPTPPTELWNEICCERGNCLGRNCKYHSDCFYIRARKRLENAQVIVVNHALLFSDVAVRGEGNGGSILPNYDVLIFDEAHTMEQVAAEHMGIELTQGSVDYLLNRLYNDRTQKGLLIEESVEFPIGKERDIFVNAQHIVDDCRFRADNFFQDLDEWLRRRPSSNGRVLEKNIIENGLSEGLTMLKEQLRRAADLIEDQSRRAEYCAARERVEAYLFAIDDWLEQRKEGFVYWLERTGGNRQRIVMRAAPIDVAPILRSQLFSVIPTVIAASATLTTARSWGRKSGLRGKKRTPQEQEMNTLNAVASDSECEAPETKEAFAFFRGRVGMTGARARALGSPFDYRKQMTLVITKGLSISEEERVKRGYDEEKCKKINEQRFFDALKGYVEETDGGAFVLFTNSSEMKHATDYLARWFAKENYPFHSQSDGAPRQLMVQKFKENLRSVLFGVDSFWQGVDVPGDALRNVIIVKFPFQAPDQPLVEARSEQIGKQGGNPFYDYQLPTAILKFKQGVGRLIRTKNDTGQVVVLDERIHTKSYGRFFLTALPDCKLRVDVFK